MTDNNPVEHQSQIGRMTSLVERRKLIPLDQAYHYLRHVELRLQPPDLFKTCNSLKIIDLTLENSAYWDSSLGHFTRLAWSGIRDRLFTVLLEQFPGTFFIYAEKSETPLTDSDSWNQGVEVEFRPTKNSRSAETYRQQLSRLSTHDSCVIENKFRTRCNEVQPADFIIAEKPSESKQALSLMQRFNDICEEEAERGKYSAEQLWNHLAEESKKSSDKRQRRDINKKMNRLAMVWGIK